MDKTKKQRILRTIGIISLIFFIIFFLCMGAGGIYVYSLLRDLPSIEKLKKYDPPVITKVFDSDENLIAEFYKERRIVLELKDIPVMLRNAFLAAEDSTFYEHAGVNPAAIIRAFIKNLQAGEVVQGGSTITQQVTKALLLSPERKLERKIKEAVLAFKIDKFLTKDEILYIYLNHIYLGHAAYGVEAAANNYFGKNVRELNLAECAMIAGLPRAPSRYSPFVNPGKARLRKNYVLRRMLEDRYINKKQFDLAMSTRVEIIQDYKSHLPDIPYFIEHIRRYLESSYSAELLYNGGLSVYTTIDLSMQEAAKKALSKGLFEIDKRQGYRGPLGRLETEESVNDFFKSNINEGKIENPLKEGDIILGVVDSIDSKGGKVTVNMGDAIGVIPVANMDWARSPDPDVLTEEEKVIDPAKVLSSGDVIKIRLGPQNEEDEIWELFLEQDPVVQASVTSIEAKTGYVRAMVGGLDFKKSQFNRAVQAYRQPGSAFKPVIYSAALDKGYTPATIIIDSSIVYSDKNMDEKWKPSNYNQKFFGPTLFRTALIKSRNVVTIKIVQDIGLGYLISYAKKMGISSALTQDLSLALGSSEVTLLELTNAYTVFPNLGDLVKPIFITKITDKDNEIIEINKPVRKQVIPGDTAFIMSHLLQEVVKYGTGWRLKALNRPAGGKTGTSNEMRDAWFVGFTPSIVTGVWVGFDDNSRLGKYETGSKAASPIWLYYMREALKGKPVEFFNVPEGIVFVNIDPATGALATPNSAKSVLECFKQGTEPKAGKDETEVKEDLFRMDF